MVQQNALNSSSMALSCR